ncbi:hypothetical protein E2562_029648 [Oryza meyeriana var. granulata]|uniref:DUF834 domain-containing protein n=1 Tax=Oryza meyeriana var. granulata TaxID=110450 RepID=A0A6G1FDW1_9ORYZ|nr:hypothetical protein E2562_029648 [Oryza meyeriana var. granulata]
MPMRRGEGEDGGVGELTSGGGGHQGEGNGLRRPGMRQRCGKSGDATEVARLGDGPPQGDDENDPEALPATAKHKAVAAQQGAASSGGQRRLEVA